MNELIKVRKSSKTGKQVVATTSLLVAQKFGKEHFHILRDIKEILLKQENPILDAPPMFHKTTYLSAQNKELPMYYMNRDGFSLLVMGFTGDEAFRFKIDFINAFNEMESKLNVPALPQNYKEALLAIVEQVEIVEKQQEQLQLQETRIATLEPQAAIALGITYSGREYGMSEVAKIIDAYDVDGNKLGRNKFFKILREQKVLRGNNEPYQLYVDSGYFIYKTNLINDMAINTCYVTSKGLAWLEHNHSKFFGNQ